MAAIHGYAWRYICVVFKRNRELFFGLARVQVLVYAAHEPIFALAVMEDLARHAIALVSELFTLCCTVWSATVCCARR